MNVHPDLSFLAMIAHASVVVQVVMALLLLLSLLSWWYIFLKLFALQRARARAPTRFEREFWSGGDLNELYQRASQARDGGGAGAHLRGRLPRVRQAAQAGQRRRRRRMDGARRAMRATYQREMDALEAHLSFLATVGSVQPYVGLFGTVWGIMNAFRGLANVSQATLAQVAPGIAEALIATAIGLFAAIPAVVAYNRFAHDIDRLATRFESFMEEFSNILQRQALTSRSDRCAAARKSMNQINVVPYIDVMLVLLVIFMVTAPLINPGRDRPAEVGSKLTAPVAAARSVARAPTSRCGCATGSARPPVRVSRDELLARVRDASRRSNPDQAVVIAADKNVRYEEVLGVLDLLQRNGVQQGRAAAAAAAELIAQCARARDGFAAGRPASGSRLFSRSRCRSASSLFLVFNVTWQNPKPEARHRRTLRSARAGREPRAAEAAPPAPPPEPTKPEPPQASSPSRPSRRRSRHPAPPKPSRAPPPRRKPDIALKEKQDKAERERKEREKQEAEKRGGGEEAAGEAPRRSARAAGARSRRAEGAGGARAAGAATGRRGRDARQSADADYVRRIQAKIRGNVVVPPDLRRQSRSGIRRRAVAHRARSSTCSSRNRAASRAYDEAVQRAIIKSSPLPRPDAPDLFRRNLTLKFRPLD